MYNTIVFVKNDMIINELLLKCMWPKSSDRVAENTRLGRKLPTVATFCPGGFHELFIDYVSLLHFL